MMLNDNKNNVFEDCQLWPLYFSLFEYDVVTIWGDAMLDKDMLLSKDGYLYFFKEEIDLVKYIQSGESCNFTGSPGYLKLTKTIKENGWDYEHINPVFDFRETGILLEDFYFYNWNSEECSMIVNCINTILDAAYTIKDNHIISLFYDKTSNGYIELKTFLDELTFYDPAQPDAKLVLPDNFDHKKLYSLYAEAIGRICLKSIIYG